MGYGIKEMANADLIDVTREIFNNNHGRVYSVNIYNYTGEDELFGDRPIVDSVNGRIEKQDTIFDVTILVLFPQIGLNSFFTRTLNITVIPLDEDRYPQYDKQQQTRIEYHLEEIEETISSLIDKIDSDAIREELDKYELEDDTQMPF